MEKYEFSKKRSLVKYCPCGRSNNDGKFVPFKYFEKSGYCHSCCKMFYPNGEAIIESCDKTVATGATVYHDFKLLEKTMLLNAKNNFIEFLLKIFPEDEERVEDAIRKYLIGTLNKWEGVVVFWQIDQKENVCYGKIMQYDPETGKRVFREDGCAYIDNVKTRLKLKSVNAKQCLFGLHLVDKNTEKIALVESEKTAVIMSIFMPQYVWLATGSKGGFKYDLLKAVRHCKIIAFPDKEEYSDWMEIAVKLNKLGFKIKVEDKFENLDYPKGTDLADLYIDLKLQKNEIFQKKNEWEYSEDCLEVYRMFQERKHVKLEMTREQSYEAIKYFVENDTEIMQIVKK